MFFGVGVCFGQILKGIGMGGFVESSSRSARLRGYLQTYIDMEIVFLVHFKMAQSCLSLDFR